MPRRIQLLLLGTLLWGGLNWTSKAVALETPTPERAVWDMLAGTEASTIKRATGAGSMLLEAPEQQLLAIADLPATAIACELPTWWWLAIVFQLAASGSYVIVFKPKQLTTGWLWLVGISVIAYMVYASIGCSCSGSRWCSYYIFINLGLLVLAGGWSYWRRRGELQLVADEEELPGKPTKTKKRRQK